MITPIRGRKHISFILPSSFIFPIRNDNPDKGTETRPWQRDGGRAAIRNDNPDKGTETERNLTDVIRHVGLEMITPIRGRKHKGQALQYKVLLWIRNDNPDKGTETSLTRSYIIILFWRLEMITPIRGRKLPCPCAKRPIRQRLEMITPIRGRKQW